MNEQLTIFDYMPSCMPEPGVGEIIHKNIIAEQPTADVRENKKGKWIKIRPDKRGYTCQFECSNCHFYTYTHNLETDIDYDFCPYCGARMVE